MELNPLYTQASLIVRQLTDDEVLGVSNAANLFGTITPDVAGYEKAKSLFSEPGGYPPSDAGRAQQCYTTSSTVWHGNGW